MFKSNKTTITGSIILAAGIIIMAAGFALGGFRIREMNGVVYTQEEYTPTTDIRSFILDDRNTSVEVKRSHDNRFRVKYYESKYKYYSISEEDGILSFRKETTEQRISIFYNMFNFSGTQTLTVYLPADALNLLELETSNGRLTLNEVSAEEIKLKSTNGRITLENVRADNIEARTTNGRLEFEEITATNEVRARSTNGSVSCDELTAALLNISTTNSTIELESIDVEGEITLQSTNGRLELSELRSLSISAQSTNGRILAEDLTAGNILLKTSNSKIEFSEIIYTGLLHCETRNGLIRGRLPGKLADYSVRSRTTNASNNLPENMQIGELQLEVETTNGKIDVSFGEIRDFDDDD